MKNLFVIFFLLFAANLFAQKINVTPITPYSGEDSPAYSFMYDKNTGQWTYANYDTARQKSILLGSKGNSDYYDFIADWNVIFDSQGNSYTYAYNNRGDEKYVYFFLINGKQHAFYDNISYAIVINNGILYFIAEQNEKSFLVKYDLDKQSMEYGKHYDRIYCFPDFEDIYYYEGSYTIYFTPEGKPVYIAEENNKKFVVTGDVESKKYDDIIDWNAKKDLKGIVCYTAAENTPKGRKEFVVQGMKEYKKFYGISYIDTFTTANVPVYAALDSVGPDKTLNYVISGNDVKSTGFDMWISNIEITPAGKLAYSGAVLTGKDKYKDVLYIDDEEIASYEAISYLSFDKKGKPFFVATKNEKSYVVYDDDVLNGGYSSIYNAGFLEDGRIFYAGVIYGDYEKKIKDRYFIHIGGEKFGPYDGIGPISEYPTSVVFSDKSGNYAYLITYITDFENYKYKYAVKSNKFESGKYDFISNLNIYKGNFYYFAENFYEDVFYYDDFFKNGTKIGEPFQNPGSVKFDKEKGIYSFVCIIDKNYSYVEIDLNR